MRTPDDVLDDIRKTRHELVRGSSAIYTAEVKAETADLAAQKAEDIAFLSGEGSVDARKAQARIAAETELLERAVTRAEWNRVKTKIRALESALMSYQAELKYMQAEGA